ncbi:Trafficking protein particle complex subunit 33 [Tulasnella sp. JGI-2019a]|nr:Trafficking protein particle complex subunit 33 [Tulasnella sp. JGI-2019a]
MSGSGIYGPSTTSSSLVTPALALLAQDNPPQIDSVALDFLLIELVQTLKASSRHATVRLRAKEEEMINAGLLPPPLPPPPSKDGSSKEDEEEEDALRLRLEDVGASVGGALAERLSKDKARFPDTLDAIKFICKDLWSAAWAKQVDNLRTNHRGVYVVQDNAFKPLLRLSSPSGNADALKQARLFVAVPTGIIRGALGRLGLTVSVTPEVLNLPQCTFQIKLPKGQ